MGVNIDKMRRKQEEFNRRSDISAIKGGDTVYYVHPPCRPDDKDELTADLNYIRVRVHYGVGPNNNMVPCLDAKRNPIIRHPFVKEFLEKKGIEVGGACPVCRECNSDTIDPDLAHRMRPQFKYVWGVTPLKHRETNTSPWSQLDKEPAVIMTGKTVFEGLMELFYDNGDITDPQHTIFAQVRKTGKGAFGTKYSVSADNATLKKPAKLPGAFVAKLKEAFQEKVNLFRVVADMVRSNADVDALFAGVPVEEEKDDMDANSGDDWGMTDDSYSEEQEQLDGVFGGSAEAESEDNGDWGSSEEPASETAETNEDDETLSMLEDQISELNGD